MIKKRILAVSLVIFTLLVNNASAMLNGRVDYTCSANTLVSQMLERSNLATYSAWIERLSGEVPVSISGQRASLDTRYTAAMFLLQSDNARAFEYVAEQARHMLRQSQVWEHEYSMYLYPNYYTARNLVVDLPGIGAPDEVVILSAHLDSISELPYAYAPGADDNATGAAALLEATRLLRNLRFNRTIRLIWFTGEEQGLKGSSAYAYDPEVDLSQVVGVINLDMFGYDDNSDMCFEMHVGTLEASDGVGQCMATAISNYGLNLSYDYITDGAITASDHSVFWGQGIGAVEILENAFLHSLPGGCIGADKNPNYHKTSDILANMHAAYAFEIAKAAVASAAGLASAQEVCLQGLSPRFLDASVLPGSIDLTWSSLPGAASYRIFRSVESCGGAIDLTADVSAESWRDTHLVDGRTYHYWVEALSPEGCFSLSDGCAVLQAEALTLYLPVVLN